MIPRGICIDLETTIAAKISDIIRPTGFKRFETRIIEIGACHWKNTSSRFMRLVNPITVPLTSGIALMQHLKDIHQKPVPTLNFWSKVLVKRKSVHRSMFSTEEDPEVWLARKPETRANDFVRWFNGDHGPEFVSESDALSDLLEWSGQDPWLAHNGNSFDFKVLQGCAERTGLLLTPEIMFHDTLKLFRKYIPGHKSYSQPILYEKIFSEKYNAHVAIDDALALARLCVHCSEKSVDTPSKSTSKTLVLKPLKSTSKMTLFHKTKLPNIKTRKAMDLTFGLKTNMTEKIPTQVTSVRKISQLSGVGPKTCNIFADIKVRSLEELIQRYDEGGSPWLQNIVPFGANWKQIEKSIVAASPQYESK